MKTLIFALSTLVISASWAAPTPESLIEVGCSQVPVVRTETSGFFGLKHKDFEIRSVCLKRGKSALEQNASLPEAITAACTAVYSVARTNDLQIGLVTSGEASDCFKAALVASDNRSLKNLSTLCESITRYSSQHPDIRDFNLSHVAANCYHLGLKQISEGPPAN